MAGGGNNGEINPFISYVDLFSSIILVLLLFVLIMFVNIGYYMQFNAKKDSAQQTETVKQSKQEVKEEVAEGNTISKKNIQTSAAEFREAEMLVVFKDNEYFLAKDIIRSVSTAMSKTLKGRPGATFVISVGDSKKIISSTQTKQVSLGRVLSLKNALETTPAFKDKIKVDYKQPQKSGFEFGYIKIDVR
jgi:hypothetical protein